MDPHVEHEPGRFVVRTPEGEATLEYVLEAGVLDVQHTFTPPALRGRQLAERLTQAAFTYAREKNLRVRPTCTYTQTYFTRHPELASLKA
jgi:uncharacterized protein